MPFYKQLEVQRHKNKAMLDAISGIKQQLERSEQPLGIHHKNANIPKYYRTRYDLQVLYHFEMPEDHRLMYTIRKSLSGRKEALAFRIHSP